MIRTAARVPARVPARLPARVPARLPAHRIDAMIPGAARALTTLKVASHQAPVLGGAPQFERVDASGSTTAHLMNPELQGDRGGLVHSRKVGDLTLHLGVSNTKRELDCKLPGNGGLRVWSYESPDLAVRLIPSVA